MPAYNKRQPYRKGVRRAHCEWRRSRRVLDAWILTGEAKESLRRLPSRVLKATVSRAIMKAMHTRRYMP